MLTATLTATLFSCTAKKEQQRVVIGYQFGTAYAPLELMKARGMLEENMPGVTVEWRQLGGPTPIREGMLNGEITFGFMGVCPVLIGMDNGMPWKYACALSANEVAVITRSDSVQSLKDLNENDRIAILSPGCTQHVLLSLLAKEQLGDASALDAQLVSMTHPDAVNALLSGTEISVHVTTPPYIQKELSHGMHRMADGTDIMGEPFTFICSVAMEETYENNRETYDLFYETLAEAIDEINRNTEAVSAELAPVYGISPEALYEQMTYNGTIYSTELQGIEAMRDAMLSCGFLRNAIPTEDLVFE
ncbi:MAG: ABC transporter substrate-binding protein [Lachnospiraceae bacterium]|nr:ABC transporter substrate-binding protein [Lachnospiraceae bacterium]